MSFILSKLLWPFAAPGNFLVMLAVLGLGLQVLGGPRWSRFGLGISAVFVALLVALTVLPVATWSLVPLEGRFPVPALPDKVDGVIVLGGAVDASASAAWGRPSLNHAADRMIEFAALARRYPEARLLFSGGSGSLTNPELAEAPVARQEFERLGMALDRISFDGQSRNTYENAIASRDLVKPRPGETWVLITSAYHMPRAVGVFRKIGWPVVPDPVAFRSGKDAGSHVGPGLSANLYILDDVIHEWIGLVAYRLMGRTDSLFPGPSAATPSP
jgi:uncharacterized SAM-binding protein YcdF (DUF218 family)